MNLTRSNISGKFVLCGDIQDVSVIQLALFDFACKTTGIKDQTELEMRIHAFILEADLQNQIKPFNVGQENFEGE